MIEVENFNLKNNGAVQKPRCQEPQLPYVEETLQSPSIYGQS
jgi:hypothetical protein